MITKRFSFNRLLSVISGLLLLITASTPLTAQSNAQNLLLLQQLANTASSAPGSINALPLANTNLAKKSLNASENKQTKPILESDQTITTENPTELSSIEQQFNNSKNKKLSYSIRVTGGTPPKKATPTNPYLPNPNTEDEPIRQFGYDIFTQAKAIGFNPYAIPVGHDYILGPGDEIIVNIWGKLEQRYELVIDRQGQVTLPKAGQLNLANKSYGDAEKLIRAALNENFANFEVSVSLGRLREIKVFVLGDVENPGTYTLPAYSTAFMALLSAGGPTKKGSLRDIEIKRRNTTIQKLDLYNFILKGEGLQDPTLQPFDVVFIPPIGNVIKIAGTVKREGLYEIKSNMSAYDAITEIAGGLTAESYKKRLQIERIENGLKRIIQDIHFDSDSEMKKNLSKTPIKNGDAITIFPILKRQHQIVQINGQIKRPGDYAWNPQLTLQQLIQSAEGLQDNAYTSRVDILRYISETDRQIIRKDLNSPDDQQFKLQEFDIVRVYAITDIERDKTVYIEGALKSPGGYRLLENMKILDLLYITGIENTAELKNIELLRSNGGKPDELFSIDGEKLMQNPNSTQNILLEENDRIIVRENPKITQNIRVTLSGEVKYPGKYLAREGEKLSTIIRRAGGFTDNAFLKGAIFRRHSVSRATQTGKQKILETEQKRLVMDQARVQGLNPQTQQAYQDALTLLKETINNEEGRIVISLTALDQFENSPENIPVEDLDSIEIPPIPNSVQIIGGVQQPSGIIYQPKKTAHFYIAEVGGFSEFADTGRIYILKPNGSISRKTNTIEVGDTIYIPETVHYAIDWFKVMQFIFNAAVTYKVISTL